MQARTLVLEEYQVVKDITSELSLFKAPPRPQSTCTVSAFTPRHIERVAATEPVEDLGDDDGEDDRAVLKPRAPAARCVLLGIVVRACPHHVNMM